MYYSDAVIRAGGLPLTVTAFTDVEVISDAVAKANGILFVGGPDYHPEAYGGHSQPEEQLMPRRRHDADMLMAQVALATSLPILGVCGGLQLLAIASGAALIQDIPSEVSGALAHQSDPLPALPREHSVRMVPGTNVHALLGDEVMVNTYHHQAVRPDRTGTMRVAAHAPDGVIEAMEDPRHRFRIGVQWHPERMVGSASESALFAGLIEAARRS